MPIRTTKKNKLLTTKMGIDKQRILDYYERKSLSEITADDLRSLIGVGTAIKEGHIKIDEVFTTELEGSDLSAAEKITNLLIEKKQGKYNESRNDQQE